MIAIVTGPPGSGKSFYAVRKIADALQAGKPVVTNIPLREDWAEYLANAHFLRKAMPGRRTALAKKYRKLLFYAETLDEAFGVRLRGSGEGRGVRVLDEIHRELNGRTWDADEDDKTSRAAAVRNRQVIVKNFSAHRHYGFDDYLLTQALENIDAQVRRNFEYHIQLRNLRRMKLMGIPVTPFNVFLAVWHWHGLAKKDVIKRETYMLNSLKKLYDTHALARELPDDESVTWLPFDVAPSVAL